MPEIVIQQDGSLLIPRGTPADNHFLLTFLKELVDDESHDSLHDFFDISNNSELIFGTTGFCG